ncbi:MAG: hypothetical protein IT381_02175 [Deltaproteobacteria bacterium]|nr:hypothetical protein [Deltaproteobacteria bacterium]
MRYWAWLDLAPNGSETKRAPRWTKDPVDALVRDDSDVSVHIVSAEKTTPQAATAITNDALNRLRTLLKAAKAPCVAKDDKQPDARKPELYWDSTLRQMHAAFGDPIARSNFTSTQAEQLVKWALEALSDVAKKTKKVKLEVTKSSDDPGVKVDQLRTLIAAGATGVQIDHNGPVFLIVITPWPEDEPSEFRALRSRAAGAAARCAAY